MFNRIKIEKNNYPLISVIIPVYNGELYIERCLLSVINQTYPNLELIVINDGSNDSTFNILSQYTKKHENIILASHKKNRGVSHARNHGLSLARGDYISFVDSDDMLLNTFYDEMLLNMQDMQSDIVQCGRIEIRHTKNGLIENKVASNKLKFIQKHEDHYVKFGGVFVWDKLFKRDIIEKFNLRFDENIKFAEDFLFLFNYKMHTSKMSFVHKYLYYYTENRNDSARNSNNNMMDIVKVMYIIAESQHILNKESTYMNDIGDVAVGYYIRRINSIVKTNPRQAKEFIVSFLSFFETYVPNWKEKITYYHSKGNLFLKLINNYRINYLYINILAKAYSFCKLLSKQLHVF